jgi:undecaprenyl diphosphate synthase
MWKNLLDRLKQLLSFKRIPSDAEIVEIIKTKGLHHLAIITDGNRRWAKENGLSPLEGHRVGFTVVAPTVCSQLWLWGVHTVTMWCISVGNWKRSSAEIDNLLLVSEELIKKMLPIAIKCEGRIIHLGKRDRLSNSLLQTIDDAEAKTAHFTKHVLNLGIDYCGSDEICRVCRKIVCKNIDPTAITETVLSAEMDTANQRYPNPDLMIRSAGEQRLSGFLLWQSKYSELLFVKNKFPEFDANVLKQAIYEFGMRKRTFSK